MSGEGSIVTPAQSWVLPLLLCSGQAATQDGPYPLDRIRMQKAVFLLTQRGAPEWAELYTYRPYDWGPYCRELTEDLNLLASNGLLRESPAQRSRYGQFMLSEQGQQLATIFWPRLPPEERRFLSSVRAYVTKKDFNGLLHEVYSAYPQYATQSRWSRR